MHEVTQYPPDALGGSWLVDAWIVFIVILYGVPLAAHGVAWVVRKLRKRSA